MRREIYAIIVLFALGTKAAQPNTVGGNNKKKPLQGTRPSTYTNKQFEIDSLKWHNNYRAKHSVNPLKLDTKLCENAQNWANKLVNQKNLKHQSNTGYGENLYAMMSSGPIRVTAGDAVTSWYNESKDYDYSKEPRTNKIVGHFTQVVWKNTKYLGVGMAKKSGKTVIVATYYPPGNVIGQYRKNVLKPKQSKQPKH